MPTLIKGDRGDKRLDLLMTRSHVEEQKHRPYTSNSKLQAVVVGDMGSGKSLLMTILATFYRNKPFYANFWLNPYFFKKYEKFSFLKLFKNPNVSAIFLDEFHNIANQFSSIATQTRLLHAIFTQARKRNMFICLSVHRFYRLPKAIREDTDTIFYPKIEQDPNNPENDKLHFTIWDIRRDVMKDFVIKNVNRFYKLYNTREIIVSDTLIDELSNLTLKKARTKKALLETGDKEAIDLVENLDKYMSHK